MAELANAKHAKKSPSQKPEPDTGKVLVPGRLADLGAILSGVLYFLAFAGWDVWPLTFFALVPLIVSLQGQTTKKATWLGFLCGLAMNLGGFYWLLEMLKVFSGFPVPACLFFVVVICAYQGGRLALMGWLYGRAANRGWPAHLVFAGAFIASELLYPLLFPWYYAATVHKVPVLMQLSDLGGPILVGLAIVAVNLGLAEPLRARLAATREIVIKGHAVARGASRGPTGSEERLALPLNRRIIGVAVLSLLGATLYGAIRISMVKGQMEKAESARVGYVQGNMALIQKRIDPNEGLRRHRRMTNELREKGVDFVVWSETSATFPAEEDLVKDKFTASLGVPAIFGAVLVRRPKDGDRERWFNSALATDASGEIAGRYDKQFLLAFGEYLPFGDTFPILYKWSPHSGRFSSGTSLDPVEIDIKGTKHKVSVLICYEDILPGFTNRAVAHASPELLVNMTNDAWFGNTTEPWEHLALSKFRAIEHRRYLVRGTNSGVSAIVDPTGAAVEGTVSRPFEQEAKDGVIRWMKGGTVYEAIGDVPWYAVSLAVVVVAFKRRKTPAEPRNQKAS